MIKIENLIVEYYRGDRVIPAVQDFSLEIAPGESVGLVGESGSGKSTVALSILRLIRPQEGKIAGGRILYQGKDILGISKEEMRGLRGRHISMIFQDPFTSLNPVMRVRDQMAEVFAAHPDVPLTSLVPELSAALERVKLDPKRVLD